MRKIAVLGANASQFRSAKRIFGDIMSKDNIVFILAAAFIFAWLPDGISGLIQAFSKNDATRVDYILPLFQTIVSGIMTFGMLYWFKKNYSQLETTIKANPVSERKEENLIIFLSFLQKQIFESTIQFTTFNDLDDRHSWIMPYKAIDHHIDVLKNLYVIPSFESNEQYKYFKNFVENTYAKNITIHQLSPIDFENIHEVYEAVDHAYALIQSEGWKNEHIVLDITGGQKVTSIVGSAFALGYGRRFQYVSTRDKSVHAYDLEYIWDE